MTGRGQPPSAARPGHLSPLLPGVRRRSAAPAAAHLPPLPTNPASSQHAPPPATVLKNMFSTCVARGIAAKLVYRTVGGKVETSLYCSTATPAAPAAEAASVISKRGRNRPDNERRRMRREAWRKRYAARTSSAAATAAATTAPGPARCVRPAVSGGVSSAPPTAAAPPPHVWAWDPCDGLLVVARRLQEDQLGSPESSLGPEYVKELNISCTSLLEEREREEFCSIETPLSYAAAAARADTLSVAADPGVETPGEAAPTAEERT
jgi:hypothetical protein